MAIWILSSAPSAVSTTALILPPNNSLKIACRSLLKNHPLADQAKISFEELQNTQWVLPAEDTPARHLFEDLLHRHGMHVPEHAVETSSLSMVRGLLMDSDRVALLSEHQIFYDKQYGVLDVLPVELERTYRPIGVTMRAHTQPSPAAELFLKFLREVSAEVHQQT